MQPFPRLSLPTAGHPPLATYLLPPATHRLPTAYLPPAAYRPPTTDRLAHHPLPADHRPLPAECRPPSTDRCSPHHQMLHARVWSVTAPSMPKVIASLRLDPEERSTRTSGQSSLSNAIKSEPTGPHSQRNCLLQTESDGDSISSAGTDEDLVNAEEMDPNDWAVQVHLQQMEQQ